MAAVAAWLPLLRGCAFEIVLPVSPLAVFWLAFRCPLSASLSILSRCSLLPVVFCVLSVVRAFEYLCRRLAAADFSLCAPRFCACVRVLRLRVLSDFLSFRKIFSVARRVGSNFFLLFGPWWRGARRVFEFFRKGLQAPPYAARVPCCCRAGVVLLCVVVCWCVCGGWCGFV